MRAHESSKASPAPTKPCRLPGRRRGSPHRPYIRDERVEGQQSPVETITPLSAGLNLTYDDKRSDSDYAQVRERHSDAFAHAGKVVLVCWHSRKYSCVGGSARRIECSQMGGLGRSGLVVYLFERNCVIGERRADAALRRFGPSAGPAKPFARSCAIVALNQGVACIPGDRTARAPEHPRLRRVDRPGGLSY